MIRASLDAQDSEIRWVDHTGMHSDVLTNQSGSVPLIQTLMRTVKICITEHFVFLVKHRLDPESRSKHAKTHYDPANRGPGSVSASAPSNG